MVNGKVFLSLMKSENGHGKNSKIEVNLNFLLKRPEAIKRGKLGKLICKLVAQLGEQFF